ncbi:MAG TPA: primase C-terminal domain-containing protein [Candidatus Acidoferrales bacterium]|nr:primase C-terminal domain-containing protein [Candidatus Acidoferrales bacterium]
MTKSSDSVSRGQLRLFRSLFGGRKDAYTRWEKGSAHPVALHSPLDKDVLTAHLKGKHRVGTYLVVDGRTKFLVLDIDDLSNKLIKKILKRLHQYQVKPYVETSKSRGFHIWVFFDKPLKAAKTRKFAKLVLQGLEDHKIEIFPKQDKVRERGFGNCIFLPLFRPDIKVGRTVFLDEDFMPHRDQWKFLESIRRTSRKLVSKVCRNAEPRTEQRRKPAEAIAGRIAKGNRNVTLASLAGTMRARGMSTEGVEAALLAENAKRCEPPLPDEEVKSIAASIGRYKPGATSGEERDSHATQLVQLADGVKLFRTSEHEAFGSYQVGDHCENWRLRDSTFKRWLASRYYDAFGKAPSSQSVLNALDVLEGAAIHKGAEREVFVRVARHESAVYLDLGDPSWRAVEITTDGWQVVQKPPVKFRRARGMKPLPSPQSGATMAELRPFLNVATDDDFILIVAWLVAALRPEGPSYPLLVLQGEQGTAKTTLARVVRELIDPSSTPVRSEPRDVRDLMIAARNSWCTVFDNLSRLQPWLSDALCRLSTGGGFSTRELYSDDQEKLFDATRPIVLNGIDGVATRGDLLDRSLVLYLPVIANEERKTEKRFWCDFYSAQPRILGALLDAVSCALRRLPSVNLPSQPRMADFAEWATAAEPSLGWTSGRFLSAYESNRASANTVSLEASAIVTPLRRLCVRGDWEGTATQLLHELNRCADNEKMQQRDWPRNAWALSIHLRRIAPNLRAAGIDVRFGVKTPGPGSKRVITMTKVIHRYPRTIQRYPRSPKVGTYF